MLSFLLELMQTPAIILGFVALIGLITQGKNFGEVFSGTLKTALGMIVVGAGASLLVGEILPFVSLFSSVFGLNGFATSAEAVVGAMQSAVPIIAKTSSIIMALGFLVNILLARFTPLKYIFLTGHMLWISSVGIAYVMFNVGYSETTIIILGTIVQGMLTTMLPALSQPFVRNLTGSNDFAIAHLTTIGTAGSAYVGKLVGNKNKSAEDIKLPEYLDFFKDTAVSVSIVMGIFYIGLVLIAGPEVVGEFTDGQNYIVFGIMKALGFSAGILILLQGVRMFLGELVPAFKGISDKLVPGAIPALDVPALFGFAPNSLMIGFITSVLGMIVAMVVSSLAFGSTPLVSIIGAFFTGGVAGIFGNSLGGSRGAIVSGFIYGFLLIFLSGAVHHIVDFSLVGVVGVGYDTIDMMVVTLLFLNPIVGFGSLIVGYVLLSLQEMNYIKSLNK